MSTTRASLLAFLTAAATLFLQVLVHRMVSAKLMNNYAFLVISLSMLGFACSGVVLSRWLDRLLEHREDAIAACASLFALSAIGASTFFYRIDVGPQVASLDRSFLLALWRWMPVALPYAVPFAFAGLILGLLLSDPRLPTPRIYFADLLGSALGAFGVIFAIEAIGVERSVLAACAVVLVGVLLIAPPPGAAVRGLAAVAALGVLAATALQDRVFEMRYPEQSMLWKVQRLPLPYGIEHIAWDPVSRIEVSRIEVPTPELSWAPSLIGTNGALHQRIRRQLTQNNWAFTYAVDYDGTPESLRGIEETVYAAAYQATSVAKPRVMVIGVGGGFDVLTALAFDASKVTGVEVNAATMDFLTRVYREDFRHWVQDPRVDLVLAEGRNHLATTAQTYDVIQLSGVDSYSGTPGAAHVFSESYLYTAEAFDLYLSRLGPGGILHVMRPEQQVPSDMLRALVTAVEALRRAGVEHPGRHIVMLAETTGHYASLLVKKTPFTDAEIGKLSTWCARNAFLRLAAAPGLEETFPNFYVRFLALDDPRKEAAFVAAYIYDITPALDDRPFFFRSTGWRHVVTSDPLLRQHAVPVMEYTLLGLLVMIGSVAALCIYLPLRHFASNGLKIAKGPRYAVFFAGIGLGYLAIEVALLQKLGLFLGHPNYAVSVVLASLLLSSGIGALASGSTLALVRHLRFLSYILAAVVFALHLWALPALNGLVGLPFWAKTLVVLVLLAPLGWCLGTFFPAALEQLKHGAPAFVPWAWGINGIFSVLAPVLSVGISMTWGISALLLASIPLYLVAGIALPEPGLRPSQAQ